MSTIEERRMVIEKGDLLAKHFQDADPQLYQAFSHVLHDFAATVAPQINLPKQDLPSILRILVESVGNAQENKRLYKTTDLAKIFGVSVQSIHKWIDQGRFVGYRKGNRNAHNRISPNTLFRLRSGELVPVGQIEEMYLKERPEAISDDQYHDALVAQNINYMKKYGGGYEETLGARDGGLTIEQDRDKGIWAAILEELRERNDVR
jgi:transposase